MPNHYEFTDEVDHYVDELIEKDADHTDLKAAGVTIAVVFFIGNGPLLCKGWPAFATIKKTTLFERANGMRDAIIKLDKSKWNEMEEHHRVELIDHELRHLMMCSDGTRIEGEGDASKVVPNYEYDSLHRPKLAMRKHDIELGIFIRDVEKYGARSLLRKQMVAIADEYGQLLFGFGETGELGLRTAAELDRAIEKHLGEVEALSKKHGASVTVKHGENVIFETGK